jgi:effector-binding domain-containing protein
LQTLGGSATVPVAAHSFNGVAVKYDIRLESSLSCRPLAVVRRRAGASELSKVVPEACGVVWNALRAKQIKGGRLVAVYLDGQINLEVGVEVDAPFAGDGDVVASSLPTGTVATTTHLGPYHKLGGAHRAICDWCSANGHALAGPNWEIYGHWMPEWNDDPSGIRTDVYYLLKTSG